MKISKSLLGAMLVGIAVQTTVSSCTKKDQDQIKPQTEKGKVQSAETPPASDPCPACGMG